MNCRIILKWILKGHCVRLLTEFNWLMIRLVVTCCEHGTPASYSIEAPERLPYSQEGFYSTLVGRSVGLFVGRLFDLSPSLSACKFVS
jgi:hypothetical protein